MTYRFGDFDLWRERYELRRGAAPVALEPRVFEVLAYLVHHRDRVVPKSELLASLWPGQYVTESALTRTIGEARRALRHEKWIKTVYGRGFAFTAPVTEVEAESVQTGAPPSSRPALPSVAVLPFADLSAARDQGYFCDGLADELIGALTGIAGLSVGSRTASFQFRNTGGDVRVIAERLNVAAVLEGSVRKEGRRLRISVQLINAADNYHLWGAVFDRRVDDVFAIQAEVAAETVRALRVVLTDRETRAMGGAGRAEPGAYDYYLRARQLCGQPSGRTLEAARQMYVRAVEADRDYAPAHAGLSETCAALHLYWRRRDDDVETADIASQRAVRVAPDLAEAHAARAQALALLRQRTAAGESFQTAVRLKPRLAKTHYSYGRFCAVAGRDTLAAHHFAAAESLSVGDCHYPLLAAMIYARQARADDARAARQRGVERAEAQVSANPRDARPLYPGAGALVALGEPEHGLEWAQRALSLDPDDSMALFYAGDAYASTGRVPRALEYLDKALGSGFHHVPWLDVVPGFASLRRDPRLRRLVRAAGDARPRARSRPA